MPGRSSLREGRLRFVSEGSVHHGREWMKSPHVTSRQWGQAVEAVHIMVDQEVESKTGTRNPPSVTYFHQLGPSSRVTSLPKQCYLLGNTYSKHQPVGALKI